MPSTRTRRLVTAACAAIVGIAGVVSVLAVSYLEKSCDRVGGFSCRVLAKHRESGTLGSYQAEAIPILLRRACATGAPDACGEHATAAETFH